MPTTVARSTIKRVTGTDLDADRVAQADTESRQQSVNGLEQVQKQLAGMADKDEFRTALATISEAIAELAKPRNFSADVHRDDNGLIKTVSVRQEPRLENL